MDKFLDSWHSYQFRYCSVNNSGLIILPFANCPSSFLPPDDKTQIITVIQLQVYHFFVQIVNELSLILDSLFIISARISFINFLYF